MKVKFLLVAAVLSNGAVFADLSGLKKIFGKTPQVQSTAVAQPTVAEEKKADSVATPSVVAEDKKADVVSAEDKKADVVSENRFQKAVKAVKSAGKTTYAAGQKTYAKVANYPKTVVAVAVASAVASVVYAYSEEIFAEEEA